MLRGFAAALQRNNKGLERREPALGQSGTFRSAIAMSALHPKADMCVATRDVRFGTTSYRRARACSGVRFGSALQNVMSALHLIATAKAKFRNRPCPLYTRKRHQMRHSGMSAKGQQRTWRPFEVVQCASAVGFSRLEVLLPGSAMLKVSSSSSPPPGTSLSE
jgi:hypothetical protein